MMKKKIWDSDTLARILGYAIPILLIIAVVVGGLMYNMGESYAAGGAGQEETGEFRMELVCGSADASVVKRVYILTDAERDRQYIVIVAKDGTAVTPRLGKEDDRP